MALIWISLIFWGKHCIAGEYIIVKKITSSSFARKTVDTINKNKKQKYVDITFFRELPGNRSSPRDNAIILASSFRLFFSFSLLYFFCVFFFYLEIKVNVIHQRITTSNNGDKTIKWTLIMKLNGSNWYFQLQYWRFEWKSRWYSMNERLRQSNTLFVATNDFSSQNYCVTKNLNI